MKQIKVITSDNYADKRGLIWTSWKKNNLNLNFEHDKFSFSKKNVIRGLHYDNKTWKLISCPYGKIFFVVVNCNPSSKDYLKYKSWILDQKKKYSNFSTSNVCKWSFMFK